MTNDYEQLVGKLDLHQKVRLLTGASMFTLAPEESIGLQALNLSDGPTGVRGLTFTGGPRVAGLPNATLVAGTWNEDTLYEVGQLLADEAERQRIHVVLGPTINLHRSPLGGRLFEAYSEDPLLTGKLAAAYVRGLQDRGIGACLKHLVLNESETDRHTVDVQADEATMREVYLLPFEIAVEESDPWSMMAAYNDVNGVAATEQDEVMNRIVKDEWGYTGLVMSDWFATKSAAPAANGGLDLVMPGPDGPWGDALVKEVEAGNVAEAVVDDHVQRLLLLADRVGGLGAPRAWRTEVPEPSSAARTDQLTRLAASGMTVLKNSDALPLRREATVALIGRHAVDTVLVGGGSARVDPPHLVSVAEGMSAVFGGRVTVVDGVEVRNRPVPALPSFVSDPETGEPGMHVSILDAAGRVLADETVTDCRRLVGADDDFPTSPTTVRLTARVDHEGPAEVGVTGLGAWTITVGGRTEQALITRQTSDLGEAVLGPPSRTRTVDVDGSITVEAELDMRDVPFTLVAIVARPAPRPESGVVADAAAAAAEADVTVVVVGLTDEQETEARDKTTLALPGAQDALVEAVAGAAARTVVVVNAATPVLMPWIDRVDAVLVAGLPGQEGGHAVTAALTGEVEPSGRLVTSYPVADGASPAWEVAPVDGAVRYDEGPRLGYRGFAADLATAPLFWFGHGLGYGDWDYLDASVDTAAGTPVVQVSVRNTSDRASREVVQVYFQPADAGEYVRLVGWTGVDVPAGADAAVTVRCDARMWRRWNTDRHHWEQLAGGGELLVARGLGDVRHRLPVKPAASE